LSEFSTYKSTYAGHSLFSKASKKTVKDERRFQGDIYGQIESISSTETRCAGDGTDRRGINYFR
ncbi:hypothetical protein, partial [Thalassospira xiamenensis]|uniref:hypothetical protein n=1 Tax=Thalassospira xiamenensis TaxID=220697 RepID=UPI001C689D15